MVSPDSNTALTFNGEIYNYLELRAQQEQLGVRFATNTDTEVLLTLQRRFNPDGLGLLEGMYGFALWEEDAQRLSLARDPFGKKPLYVARGDGWLAFASELRALRDMPGVTSRIDPEAIEHYLLLQYFPAPRTIYADCTKLEPGSWQCFDVRDGELRESSGRHFTFGIAPPVARAPRPPRLGHRRHFARLADELEPILIRAVERRLRSDVPVGAFLSGGIDSAVVVAMITKRLGIPVKSFSIGFAGAPESEHLAAREAARHLGSEHFDRVLEPNALEMLPTIAAALDEPLGDSSCLPTFLLSAFCRERVTVALSGDGGDELFGGYGRYRDTLREAADWQTRLKRAVRQREWWSPGTGYCNSRWLMFPLDQLADLLGRPPSPAVEALVGSWREGLDATHLPLIDRLRGLDANTYLPGAVLTKVDRMSMAHALEVRCPLLDREVAAFAARLSGANTYHRGVLKPVLRALASRYLPAWYVDQPKTGFGLPARAWARSDLMATCDRTLLGNDGRLAEILDRRGLESYVERARRSEFFPIYQLFTLLILELWLRRD